MNNPPLVSVIMPVRNGMPYIRSAIESICSQTIDDWELIVVDDGSTDGTVEFLDSIRFPRMAVLRSRGSGAGAARITGVERARGKYVAWMDADDISRAQRLETLLAQAELRSEIVAIGSQVEFIVGASKRSAFPYPQLHGEIVAGLRQGRPTMCNSSLLLRTDALRKVRMQPLTLAEDVDLMLRLSSVGRLENSPNLLLSVRVSRSSSSYSRIAEQRFGTAFAVECHRARGSGRPEPTIAEFENSWRARPLLSRAATALEVAHQRQFRESLLLAAEGRKLKAAVVLACSAALNPRAVWYQVRRRLWSRDAPRPALARLSFAPQREDL